MNAAHFVEINTKEQIQNLCLSGQFINNPFLILGGGSNLLFTGDFQGWVFKNNLKGINLIKEDSEFVWINVLGGEIWHELVLFSVEKGWGGIENLALIPGSVGAAPIQNIGAYGVEIKSVLESVELLELTTGRLTTFDNQTCRFGYRDSIFKHEAKDKYFIVSVNFRLKKNPIPNIAYGDIQNVLLQNNISNPAIKDVCEAVISIRKSKLPDPAIIGNAGSFFKNPIISIQNLEKLKSEYPDIKFFNVDADYVKLPAAWLIEQAGWKGKRFGNVGVHDRQALVLVNYGNGTGAEILMLANKIIESVKQKFGVILTPEVNII